MDSPSHGQGVKDKKLTVRGWALNDSGVKAVKVYVDGKFVGNAKTGISRPDVNNKYQDIRVEIIVDIL
ncbi:hypothetical protein CYK67_09060 [Clostridium perfringens]|nr:hypothetical protein CYK67_09060 [Clostridium perfringens]